MPLGLTAVSVVRQGVRIAVEEKAKAEQKVHAAIRASTFVRAGLEAQARIVQELVADGRIYDICDTGEGEYGDVVDAAEMEYDSDADFIDDDEIAEEISSSDARAASGDGTSPLALVARVHEIRIVRKGNDGTECWRCVPPRNPLSGYCANVGDNEAQLILDAVRRQFAFYSAVAAWLQDEGDDVLRSRVGFKENHKGMTRKTFHGQFCKCLDIKDDTVIHAYCQACRLSWGDASLPLESVFAPRT